MKAHTGVTDEFAALGKFINEIGNSADCSKEELYRKEKRLQKVCSTMKKVIIIKASACQATGAATSSAYITGLQVDLIDLSDQCSLLLEEGKNHALLSACSEEIHNMLQFLNENFHGGFNTLLTAPDALTNQVGLKVSEWLLVLEMKLKKHQTEEPLTIIILEYCNQLEGQQAATVYSFHELYYLSIFTATLSGIVAAEAKEFNRKLMDTLFYLNFNSLSFIRFYLGKIQKDYDQVESYQEEYKETTIHLRAIRQYLVKKDCAHDPSVDSLNQIIAKAIEEELNCLDKLHGIHVNEAVEGLEAIPHHIYFKISIPMEQLLFLFKILIDKDIVITKRKLDLFEFINRHIGTERKDNLSEKNMQNTYAERGRGKAMKTKEMLLTMIKHIDEVYL